MRVKLLAAAMRALAARDRSSSPATRLGGRHGYDAAGATSVMGGAVTGFTKALARERAGRAGQGRRLRAEPQDRGARRPADRGDPARPRRGRGRPRRRTCAGRSASVERPRGHDAGPRALGPTTRRSSSPAPPAASSRRSPPTWPRRSRRHVPPARPRRRARPATTPTSRASPPTATGSSASSPSACKRARRAPDAEARRARAGRHRARRARRSTRSRRSRRAGGTRALAPGRPHRRRAGRRRARAALRDQRPRRRPAARRRARDQPLPARQAAGASSTSSSTSRPTAGSTCCTRSATCRCGAAVAFSSIAGRFGNAGQTDYSAANDLLCKSVSHLRRTRPARAASRSTGPPGPSIGMATRGSIPKMMEMAGIDMLPAGGRRARSSAAS